MQRKPYPWSFELRRNRQTEHRKEKNVTGVEVKVRRWARGSARARLAAGSLI